MAAITLKPADIRFQLRGQEGLYGHIDRLSLSLKRLTDISDDRHYRLCFICSKLQKYEDLKAKYPGKADYYEAKKDMRLRELIQLIHEHITDLDPTEHNFYEFLIEAWGILNQEVHFSKDMYTHYLQIAFAEHAKYRATDKGELTSSSVVSFCAHLDEYVDAAFKQVVVDWYHLFVPSAATLLFATKGKKESKISPDVVKAAIRARMIEAVIPLFEEDLNPGDGASLERALDNLSTYLKAYPKEAAAFTQYFDNYSRLTGYFSTNRDLSLVARHLLNARNGQGNAKAYTFTDLKNRGPVDETYLNPFVTDLLRYQSKKAELEAHLEDAQSQRKLALQPLTRQLAALSAKIEALAPQIPTLEARSRELQQSLEQYSPTIIDDTHELATLYVRLKTEITVFQIVGQEAELTRRQEAFYAKSKELAAYLLLYRRLQAPLNVLDDYRALTAKMAKVSSELASKAKAFETLLSSYQTGTQQELKALKMKQYLLTKQQVESIFKAQIVKKQ